MAEKFEVRELTLKNGMAWPTDEELVMLILGSGTRRMPVDELSEKVISAPPFFFSSVITRKQLHGKQIFRFAPSYL